MSIDRLTKGDAHYASPEMINNKYYGLRHDVWGLGIISYFLFAGQFPWDGENDLEICDAIIKEDLNIELLKDRKVDSKIIDCINGMLLKDPSKRLTIRQVMSHKMFETFHRKEKEVSVSFIKFNIKGSEAKQTNIKFPNLKYIKKKLHL